MCSSGNPREYIQRRGRILRRSPGKKEAQIYDVIALPPLYDNQTSSQTQKEMIEKQLNRIEIFAEDALNKSEVLSQIDDIRGSYRI